MRPALPAIWVTSLIDLRKSAPEASAQRQTKGTEPAIKPGPNKQVILGWLFRRRCEGGKPIPDAKPVSPTRPSHRNDTPVIKMFKSDAPLFTVFTAKPKTKVPWASFSARLEICRASTKYIQMLQLRTILYNRQCGIHLSIHPSLSLKGSPNAKRHTRTQMTIFGHAT